MRRVSYRRFQFNLQAVLCPGTLSDAEHDANSAQIRQEPEPDPVEVR